MAWNQGHYPHPPGHYPLLPGTAPPQPGYYPPGTAAPQPPIGGYYPPGSAAPQPPLGSSPAPYPTFPPSYPPNFSPYPPSSPSHPPHTQGHWVPASKGYIPPGAVGGGFDSMNEIFVARAHKHGALLIGKLVRGHSCCYVPWGGKEHHCNDYEVLCHSPGGRWVSSACFPSDAVLGGRTERGEPLYVGRVIHHSSSVIGKIQRSHGVCYYPYGGKEHSSGNYEILVLN